MPINNDSFTLSETLMPKVLKSTCRKLWCLSAFKKSASAPTLFLRYDKDTVNLLFWEIWECLAIHHHSINLKQPFMLICMQKINFITHFFRKILQRNSKLLFWVFWACLATHTQSDTTNLKKTFMFICRQKINFIPYAFLEMLQRYGNLFGYFGHAWIHTPKMIVSICRKLWCLSACHK